MYKTIADIKQDLDANGKLLTQKCTSVEYAQRNEQRKYLKSLEIYAKKLSGISLSELVMEYNIASDALIENDAEATRLTEEFNKIQDEYRLAMQKNENMREVVVLKISAIGAAMRDAQPQSQLQLVVEPKPAVEVKKDLPDPNYVEMVMYQYDNNRSRVRKHLAAEGYDVSGI